MLTPRFSVRSLAWASTTSLAITMLSAPAGAGALDINLGDNSAQLQYSSAMGRDSLGKSEFHLGFLYTDQDNVFGDAGILVRNEVGSGLPGVTVGMGVKGIMATADDNDALALALGGQVRFSPPSASRFGIAGQFYFAPNIVTFGDADRFIETGVRLEYEVLPQAVAYLGYRKIKFGLEASPDAVLDEGAHVGVKITF